MPRLPLRDRRARIMLLGSRRIPISSSPGACVFALKLSPLGEDGDHYLQPGRFLGFCNVPLATGADASQASCCDWHYT